MSSPSLYTESSSEEDIPEVEVQIPRSVPRIFNENGSEMKVRGKEVKRHSGEICKSTTPTGITYQEDINLRTKTRSRRRAGILFRIKELLTTTGDHSYLEVYKENTDHEPDMSSKKIFTTHTNLLKNTLAEESTAGPSSSAISDENLELLSPSRSQEQRLVKEKRKLDQNKCAICKTKYNSKTDNEYGSPWIGCDKKDCAYWIHAYCFGFTSAKEDTFEDIKFFCKKHNTRKLPSESKKRLFRR